MSSLALERGGNRIWVVANQPPFRRLSTDTCHNAHRTFRSKLFARPCPAPVFPPAPDPPNAHFATDTTARGRKPWRYNSLSGFGIPEASGAVPLWNLRTTVRQSIGWEGPNPLLHRTGYGLPVETLCPMRIIVYNLQVSTLIPIFFPAFTPLKPYRSTA
jgi:hypothetical protein